MDPLLLNVNNPPNIRFFFQPPPSFREKFGEKLGKFGKLSVLSSRRAEDACTVHSLLLDCSLLSVGTVEPGAGTVQEWVSRSGVCGMFGRYRKPPLEPTYNTLQKATSGKATPAAGDHLKPVLHSKSNAAGTECTASSTQI